MRLVQVFVPEDQRDPIVERLESLDGEYILAGEADDEGVIAYVPVPTGAVEPVLAELREAGLDDDTFTVVSEAETTTAPEDAFEGEFVDVPQRGLGVSYAELHERAQSLEPARPVSLVLAVLSAVVATAGLLRNSAVVVGSMVLAPFAGSTLSASVGTVVEERETFTDSAVSRALVVEYNSETLFGEPTTVTVVLSGTGDRDDVGIAGAISGRLVDRTGDRVVVRVHVTDYSQSTNDPAAGLASPGASGTRARTGAAGA